jgi:hypothetical protein
LYLIQGNLGGGGFMWFIGKPMEKIGSLDYENTNSLLRICFFDRMLSREKHFETGLALRGSRTTWVCSS